MSEELEDLAETWQQMLYHKVHQTQRHFSFLIVRICQVKADNFDLLFPNFMINSEAVWEKMLHCKCQVA